MEDHYNVRRLALVLAKQAEIEGMKAENTLRDHRGETPTYNEGHFQDKVNDLENLAYSHNEQL